MDAWHVALRIPAGVFTAGTAFALLYDLHRRLDALAHGVDADAVDNSGHRRIHPDIARALRRATE